LIARRERDRLIVGREWIDNERGINNERGGVWIDNKRER
jgi:hypothetical protein